MPHVLGKDNDEISDKRRDITTPKRFGGITIMIVSGDLKFVQILYPVGARGCHLEGRI
jgi:hypothetical protein